MICMKGFDVLLATVMAVAMATAEAPIRAMATGSGVETDIPLANSSRTMRVRLPEAYDENRTWPVLFVYPGLGQPPTTAPWCNWAAGRNFVLVSLPHPDDQPAAPARSTSPELLRTLRQDFAQARAWAVREAHGDERRMFMGGISKGGFTASLLGEPELGRLAGLVLLLAGRSYPVTDAPDGATYRGKWIFVGAGEADPNLRSARQAAEFFTRQGAQVTFEEFAGTGHAVPAQPERLAAWLQVTGRLIERDAQARQELATWQAGTLAEARQQTDAWQQYVHWQAAVRDPRLILCEPAGAAEIRNGWSAALAASPGREDAAAEKAYLDLLWREAQIRRLEDMKAVLDDYRSLARLFPQTRWGQRAATEAEAMEAAYQRSLAATRQANESTVPPAAPAVRPVPTPAPPSFGTERIRTPVRQGNKIILK